MMTLAKRLLFFSIIFLTSCSSLTKEDNTLDIISLTGNTMGTTYSIKYSSSKKNNSEVLSNKKKIDDMLKEINIQMSTYIPESEISQFNSSKSTNWFNISSDFNYVVLESFEYYKLSNGGYDITVQPLVNLWGFGPDKFLYPPSKTEIDSVKQFIGQNLIEVESGKIRKKDPRVQIDLSSIAKGFAVDKIFNFLKKYEDIFVEIGGEIRTKSTNKSWKIGITSPSIDNISNDIEKIITLNNMSMATSGNYRNFFIFDDNFYHHEIDTRTGSPIQSNVGSISIISKTSCMDADALSTMFYTMSPEEISEIVEEDDNIESFIILLNDDESYKKVLSKNFPDS